MGGFGYSPTFAGRRTLLRPRTGALRWQGTVHGKGEEGGNARAGALAAADEGVRRCARGGRAPQLLKSSSVVGRARFAVRAAQRRNESASWPLSAIVSVTGRMVKQMATPVQALLKLCRHAYCKRYGNCFAPAIMAS